MKKVNWGASGIKVPAVALGCMRLEALTPEEAARYLEKHFIRFKETGLNKKGILLALIGGIFMFLISQYVPKLLSVYLETNICAMVSQMLLAFFIVLIWPAVIRLFQKDPSETEEA